MSALIACAILLPFAQGTVTEYTFRNIRAEAFLKRQWKILESLSPGIQLASSLENPPPTGVWVYLDAKKNKLLFGSRDDTAEWMPKYMPEFDVKPMRVQLDVVFDRPQWQAELMCTLKVPNGEVVSLRPQSHEAEIELRPRIRNDGSVSVQITIVTDAGKGRSACVVQLANQGAWFQISDGKAAFLKEGKLLPIEKITNPPIGERWRPFKIEVRASVLAEQTRTNPN